MPDWQTHVHPPPPLSHSRAAAAQATHGFRDRTSQAAPARVVIHGRDHWDDDYLGILLASGVRASMQAVTASIL